MISCITHNVISQDVFEKIHPPSGGNYHETGGYYGRPKGKSRPNGASSFSFVKSFKAGRQLYSSFPESCKSLVLKQSSIFNTFSNRITWGRIPQWRQFFLRERHNIIFVPIPINEHGVSLTKNRARGNGRNGRLDTLNGFRKPFQGIDAGQSLNQPWAFLMF